MNVNSILLVDDNPKFMDVAMDYLHRAGIENVLMVETAQNALEVARAEQPDVVLLDLGMPGTSGLEVLPVLRSILPKAAIIVLTLHDVDSYRRAALASGADGFVSKASLSSDLIPAIDAARACMGEG